MVLDPGHGGRDSATRSEGFYEKNIVLDIALELKKALLKAGYDVKMTRETDEYLPLSARAAILGDVFISIHANTVPDSIGPSVRSMIHGIEIYLDTDHPHEVLKQKSANLAQAFQEELSKLTGIRYRATRKKSLAVLKRNSSPAILIELGYLSNQSDLAFLTTPANHKQLAAAAVRAVQKFQHREHLHYQENPEAGKYAPDTSLSGH